MGWSKLGSMASSVWGGITSVIGGVLDAVGSVAKYSGMAFTAIGLSGTLALTNIVSAGATFEQKMANVASVTGATGEAFDEMSKTALDLGSNSRAGAGAAADAMYYLGSAGYDAQQTIGALEGVINLASATMSDLAFTSETVVSTITAFGLKAEDATRVSNVFAAAIAKSQLEMNNLAEGMKYIAPVAGVVGWSLEQTTAALALLSNAGFKGSIAGAALRNILSDLLNPTNQAQAAFERYGISMDMVNPEMNSLADIMRTIGNVGMSTADIMTIFGERGGPQMLALLKQGYGALETMTNQITGTNAATEMMNRQLDTVKGAWDLFKSALEGVYITLFQFIAPTLQSVIEYMTGFVQRIREWLTTN
jgi:TP901 family phage tail tape measure protein